MSIVLFGYSQFGYDALKWLLDHAYPVYAVVSHKHDPKEHIWFQTMEPLIKTHGIAHFTEDDADHILKKIQQISPKIILSVYYRYMIPMKILDLARHGAFNIHGSLLPKYRGKAPLNWAILNGETQTGLSLHQMVEKPDAGALVDQIEIPILPHEKAGDVLEKMRPLVGQLLKNNIDALLNGTANMQPMDIQNGSYFGGRTPEDGRIDIKTMTATAAHNLIRALQPYPQFPGAFIQNAQTRRILHRSCVDSPDGLTLQRDPTFENLYTDGSFEWLLCKDNTWLKIIA
ncbi:MAG: Bifunctional polymyxin resistance protein ArnA [Holosporales bacterium]